MILTEDGKLFELHNWGEVQGGREIETIRH